MTKRTVDESAIGFAAYARHRRVSRAAVSKAVQTGRLRRSLVVVAGRRMLRSIEAADVEWDANRARETPGSTSVLEIGMPLERLSVFALRGWICLTWRTDRRVTLSDPVLPLRPAHAAAVGRRLVELALEERKKPQQKSISEHPQEYAHG